MRAGLGKMAILQIRVEKNPFLDLHAVVLVLLTESVMVPLEWSPTRFLKCLTKQLRYEPYCSMKLAKNGQKMPLALNLR